MSSVSKPRGDMSLPKGWGKENKNGNGKQPVKSSVLTDIPVKNWDQKVKFEKEITKDC